MTYPGGNGDFEFRGAETPKAGESVTIGEKPASLTAELAPPSTLPPPILSMTEERDTALKIWLDQWIQDLEMAQQVKQTQWSDIEDAYRAQPPSTLQFAPFKGACTDVIPVMAMAIDPIHARLDTGIFKQDPTFTFKHLKASLAQTVQGVAKFVDFYQKHTLKLRRISSARILEMAKLGTCVFKVIYDRDEQPVLKYDGPAYEVIKGKVVRFVGPRVLGIGLGDFLFPPGYQDIQDCPVVFERQRPTFERLKVLEAAKKLANVDKIKGQETTQKTDLTVARETAAKHTLPRYKNELIIYEGWCDFDVDGDGLPERIVVSYHKDTRTLLQARLNWYFHQKKPFVLIPYTIVNDSLYGLGIGEMTLPLQLAITRWHRMASDNAYIANIRMFIVKRGSGIEEVPRIYAGRCFFVDEPGKDFIPFQMGDIYPSTLAERQNLFGMVEKRTGVSDYLVGRESPIVGSRATATSTLALIQEGTRRVEEVLENLRVGFAEIMEFCFSIWIQFGTGGLEDVVFGGEEVAQQVKDFFAQVSQENVNGVMAVELTATDASTSRQAMQQMQLALIQITMQYLEKVIQAGQGAIEAAQMGVPEMTMMISDVMEAARKMFRDLLDKYDIRNPDDYLPDLRKYLGDAIASAGQGVGGSVEGQSGGPQSQSSLPVGSGPARLPAPARPATPGSGNGAAIRSALAGASQGGP